MPFCGTRCRCSKAVTAVELFSALYAHAMTMPMPVGVPFYYEPNDDHFVRKFCTAKKFCSKFQKFHSIRLHLYFCKTLVEFFLWKFKLAQSLCFGWQIWQNGWLPGSFSHCYHRWKNFVHSWGWMDSWWLRWAWHKSICVRIFWLPVILFHIISYNNKFLSWHTCKKCRTDSQSDTTERDQRKISALRRAGYIVTVMRSCEWEIVKRGLPTLKSPFSIFYYKKKIFKSEIVDAVRIS